MSHQLAQSSAQCWAIVPAAGLGHRMQSTIPKQYLQLNGRPIIEHCLLRLLEAKWITGIVVAISEDDSIWRDLSISHDPRIKTVTGGDQRVDSVSNALFSIQGQLKDDDLILVHDAARPCLNSIDLQRLYQAAASHEAGVILADKITDTVKRDDGNGLISQTLSREGLWRALTPQIFPKALLLTALEQVKNKTLTGITDEASAIESMGSSPYLLQGRRDNIKVTIAEDIQLASLILKAQASQEQREQQQCE